MSKLLHTVNVWISSILIIALSVGAIVLFLPSLILISIMAMITYQLCKHNIKVDYQVAKSQEIKAEIDSILSGGKSEKR